MNILPFVFTILLIFAYTGAASFQKYFTSRQAQSAYIGLRKAERTLQRKTEKKQYKTLPGTLVILDKGKKEPRIKSEEKKIPSINPSCARLNLFPLINEGRETHPELYNMALKVLQLFYQEQIFLEGSQTAARLLDSLLASAKQTLKDQDVLALETLALNEETLQPLYYRLLKGTKHSDLFSSKGYPALIDYFKIERVPSQICLFHAHPHMLAPFFGTKTALRLYKIVHQEKKAGFEIEALITLLGDAHLRFTPPAVWELIDLKRPHHSIGKQTLIAEDKKTGISLRKTLPM